MSSAIFLLFKTRRQEKSFLHSYAAVALANSKSLLERGSGESVGGHANISPTLADISVLELSFGRVGLWRWQFN
jgi:hypothetical protein